LVPLGLPLASLALTLAPLGLSLVPLGLHLFPSICWSFCYLCSSDKDFIILVLWSNIMLSLLWVLLHESPSWNLCPASEDFCGSDTGFRNHWPCALEPTPSFDAIHFINWWAKCLFSFAQDCSLLSGSLALEALLIGVHCKKCYLNV